MYIVLHLPLDTGTVHIRYMNVETDTGYEYPTYMYVHVYIIYIYYVSVCVYDVLVHVYTMMSDEFFYLKVQKVIQVQYG